MPLNDLKLCRLMNKNWNFEICSYIKDFRQCNANIFGRNPCCSDLTTLGELVSQWTTTVPINSLSINLLPHLESLCEPALLNKADIDFYSVELVKKLPLKFLYIWFSPNLSSETRCPEIEFVMTLLRERLQNLQLLRVDRLPEVYLREFG